MITTLDYMYKRIKDRIEKDKTGKDKGVLISYFGFDRLEDNLIEDNLDDIFIEGKCIFIHAYYQSKPIDNPTWLDILFCANDSIRDKNQFYYIEDIELIVKLDNIFYYKMIFSNTGVV